MQNPDIKPGRQALAAYLRSVLEQRHLSGRQLARLAGISEATVRALISPEKKRDLFGPHPLVLRAISQALDLDLVQLMVLIGYLDEVEPPMRDISLDGVEFAFRLNRLPQDKQAILWNLLAAVEKASGLPSVEEHQRQLLRRVQTFRQAYPVFRRQRFKVRETFDQLISEEARQMASQELIDEFIVPRLNQAFDGIRPVPVTYEAVRRLLTHPDVILALNDLLVHKAILAPVEKLSALIRLVDGLNQPGTELVEEQHTAIRALWLFLEAIPQGNLPEVVK